MAKKNTTSYIHLAAMCLAFLALTGCDSDQPVSYQIPKELRESKLPLPSSPAATTAPDMPAPAGMQLLPGMAEAAQAAGDLSYSAPASWIELPASGIRKATLQASDSNGSAELSVLVFPGDVGGTLANVNRWLGQIELPPITDAGLADISSPYTISHHAGIYVRLKGETQAILGGILPFHGSTWFFKFIGDRRTVLANETQLKAFLDSVALEDDAH